LTLREDLERRSYDTTQPWHEQPSRAITLDWADMAALLDVVEAAQLHDDLERHCPHPHCAVLHRALAALDGMDSTGVEDTPE
jgi:hypothetical protein